jgi:hypothetical protein
MQGQPDRIEQFKADIADLRITDPSTARDQMAVRVGLLGMAAGAILPIFAYFMSHGTTTPLTQRDALVLAVMGLGFAAGGGALYLKGSLAGFLRFWLVRDLHERRAQTDRVLAHLHGGERPDEGELP